MKNEDRLTDAHYVDTIEAERNSRKLSSVFAIILSGVTSAAAPLAALSADDSMSDAFVAEVMLVQRSNFAPPRVFTGDDCPRSAADYFIEKVVKGRLEAPSLQSFGNSAAVDRPSRPGPDLRFMMP